MRLIPKIILRLQVRFGRAHVLLVLWMTALVGLEVAGRLTTSELGDAFAVAVVVCLAFYTVRRHQSRPVWVLTRLEQRLKALGPDLKQFDIEVGVDLRGLPAIAPALPGLLRTLGLILTVAAAVLLLSKGTALIAVLMFLRPLCYTAYVLGIGLLWFSLLAGLLLAVMLPLMLIHDAFVLNFTGTGPRTRQWEVASLIGYPLCLLAAGCFLPRWVLPAMYGALLLLNMAAVALPGNPSLQLLWRVKGGRSPLRAIGWRRFVALEVLLVTLFSMTLLLAGSGSRMWPTSEARWADALPATALLAAAFGWAVLGALGVLTCRVVRFIFSARHRNPGAADRPCLYVSGHTVGEARRRVADRCRQQGWRACFLPDLRGTAGVTVTLVGPSTPGDHSQSEPCWPLPVTLEQLEKPELWARLARRDEIHQRRQLTRGLERLFKRAARRQFKAGHGYVIGIQHWFIAGLCRDEQETELDHGDQTLLGEFVGPAYHRLLSRRARHHFFLLMRALDLDLIFVQDGVGFRKLRNVLRVMFEVYDIHGGRQRAEERHFTGIAGLRVVIHDYETTEPLIRLPYPEPEYEVVARARVMEIFRDRGGPQDRCDDPVDTESIPVPELVF